jgi:Flp pilus assembly protein TadG
MKRLFRRFFSDRRGAFAIQFALMAVPMFACAGVAIDGGRAFLARFELSSALDSAALAAGSTDTEDEEVLAAVARRFVDSNFQNAEPGAVRIQLEPGAEVMTVRGEVEIETYFMGIVGIPNITVSAESEVRRGGTNVEVALVLDTTESMAGQRMIDLKAAAADLVDIVVTDKQEPYFSKLALVSYGGNVHAGEYADDVRGEARQGAAITAAEWKIGYSRNISDAEWKDGSSVSISGISRANQAVVSADRHGFEDGDIVYISGVRGMTQVNGKAYRVDDATRDTFKLRNVDSNAYVRSSSWSRYTSRGTLEGCLLETCEVQVTSNSHGFSNGDHVHISGVQGMTQINNDDDESWTIKDVTGNSYVLEDSWGPDVSDYSRSGAGQRCITPRCEVQVSADGHGLSNGDWVYITGARGMAINTSGSDAWQVAQVSGANFILEDREGPGYGAYTGNGVAWCLEEGCQYYRYTSAANRTTIREISECVSERIGAQAYTDSAPSIAAVGRVYAGGGYSGCRSYGAFEPLSAGRDAIKAKITALDTDDSTAGQIGLAWGWYMLSPNWGSLWPDDVNRPGSYTQENLAKVLVLMTDGDFNTAYCRGVVAKNAGVGNSSDKIDCNATNGDAFDQAESLCDGIKAQDVTIYTVGFGNGLSGNGGDFLRDCATSANHAYLAATGDELKEAFSNIARSISLLRLSR